MNLRKIHYSSGIILSIFIGLHLFNHLFSIFGADKHIELMNTLRLFYRNIFAESVLFMAELFQIVSGIRLFRFKRKLASSFYDKLQLLSGLYLAVFLVFHTAAVLGGRFLLQLDTNFYFGAAGLNTFPFNLFFVPYYGMAIISFFGHISSFHFLKMKHTFLGYTPGVQSRAIFVFGILLTVAILYGLTNHFNGHSIPAEYLIFPGK